ncbi:MAG: GCN5-related N-acetyltransferase [uncultured Friedmanniella sp.]|uniref:GCN5-related N-acetyltransferase n=1 Tax=uncultured Friedmanniella sp. TaxID=335381 RepID=A0A6J4KKH4_9ACTN|nr:GNAT family N-acetyltransferase [uncultured Friedmanniella sp.]CAA9308740.1 MAG: GCN5-related N-acetyltransferase [uncultured Friedmanniella sp.]
MDAGNRRVWRASPATLAAVVVFMVAAAVPVPLLAYVIWSDDRGWVTPALLATLSLVALGYAWRFGLHPRLRADRAGVTVVNPFSTSRFTWEDLRVIAPGENGLVLATPDARAEAWCIQKSNLAARKGRMTRADKITSELFELLEEHDPPLEDEETGLRIRRARPDESRVLTRLERAASEEALQHLFPPDRYPYPVAEVNRRWRRLLRDPQTRVVVLEKDGEPVGFVAFDTSTVRHLGVLPDHTRRGYGSALLEFAATAIFEDGATSAGLWVLEGNTAARAFYRSLGWTETSELRSSEFPPRPTELRLERRNPAAPRRGR